MSKLATILAVVSILTLPLAAQGVVINEIYTGDPDYLEIANFSDAPVDLSGWTIASSFGLQVYPVYFFPSGTFLGPGECLVLLENVGGSLPTSSPQPPFGTQILYSSINWGWIGTSSGSVVLVDVQGVLRDLVIFGTGPVAVPPGTGSYVYTNPINRSLNNASIHDAMYRVSNVDTNDGQDWFNGIDGADTPGALNPGQTLAPLDARALVFDPDAVNIVTIDGTTFTVTAQVKAIRMSSGALITDPTLDGMIGGIVSVQGLPISGDASTLNGALIVSNTITISTVTGDDVLSVTSMLTATGAQRFELGGGFGAKPRAAKELRTPSYNLVSRGGSGQSATLTSLYSSLTQSALSLLIVTENFQHQVVALEKNFDSSVLAPFTSDVATNGEGAVEIGIVGAAGGEIYNLFALNPMTPLGQGAAFGIELQPIAYDIVALPLGVAPFHVAPTAAGTYYFVTPNGMLPAGFVVQHVAGHVANGTLTMSAPRQITF